SGCQPSTTTAPSGGGRLSRSKIRGTRRMQFVNSSRSVQTFNPHGYSVSNPNPPEVRQLAGASLWNSGTYDCFFTILYSLDFAVPEEAELQPHPGERPRSNSA